MLANFSVIMKIRTSASIGHLSSSLARGGLRREGHEKLERVLSGGAAGAEQLLTRHGYDVGEPDVGISA